MASVVSMKQLFEAGVHFGHQTRRWNPKMAEYIFTERNGIYIIDLQKTVKKLNEAYNFARDISADGKDILFVGTKKQAQDSVKEEAENCGMPFVNARWLGGMLTNFRTIRTRIKRLNDLRKMEEDGTFDLLPKKEVIQLRLEEEKLEKFLGGIQNMEKMPGALFIVDPRKERIAVMEAKKLGIPIIAIVDTNCDPDEIDAVIPGNDDAIRAVKLIASTIAAAVIEGRQGESNAPATDNEEMVAETLEEVAAEMDVTVETETQAKSKEETESEAEVTVKEEAEAEVKEKPKAKTKSGAKAKKEEVQEAAEAEAIKKDAE